MTAARRYLPALATLLLAFLVLCCLPPAALGQANVTGQWQTLPNLMPINPTHVTLMRNGKVLVVTGSGNGTSSTLQAGIFDPQTGTVSTQTLAWDMFCNGMVALSDGRVFINGGNGYVRTAVYDPGTGLFTDLQSMAHGRWYPTVTELADGAVMTFSGSTQSAGTNTTVEIYTVGTGWSQEFGAGWTPPLYPRMHLLPDGTVFYSGSGAGSRRFNPPTKTWTGMVAWTNYGGTRTYGTSVLLPLTPANNYKPRVMILGGNSPATATTELIDFSAATPAWQFGPSMSQARIEMNATILPNGKVLATGGSLNDEDATTASLNADLYDPTTNTFGSGGQNAFPRLYHSVSLLLPDATVWLAGSNPTQGFFDQHMEIYSPPYLFNSSGGAATRPTITSVPASINYGNAFLIQTPDAASVSSIALVRPGSPTHAFDMDQRLINLSFTAGAGTLNATAPPNGNIAPPGYYMLFILNSSGVPSVAKFVQLILNPASQPPTATVTSPASDVTIATGQPVLFSGSGSAPGGTIASYSWVFPGGNPSSSSQANPGNVIYSTPGTYVASLTVTDNLGLTSSAVTRIITVQTVPAMANFVGADTSTKGNWHGVYGADGYSIANDTQSVPGYAVFSVEGQANYTWATGISDPRALQTGSNTGRIASTWYSITSFAFDVNLTDGNSHRFALYALDWDSTTRVESVEIVDANGGAVLDTRNISLFNNGIYLIWNLSGHVRINVTLTGGGNAVISGAFFGGSSSSETVTVSPASVSLGANQQKQFTATVTGAANQTVSWSISAVSPPTDAPGNLSSSGLYTAPATITPGTVTIKATSADGTASGTATVNLSNGAVAGFVGTDTSTQGNWHGIYGADGYSIANDTQSLPAYATFAAQNQLSFTWATGITDVRALQTGNNTGRVASTWYSSSSFSFDVNFTDGSSHQFALYALDWDSTTRAESVQVVDANSGAVLDTRNISLFNNGIYLIWNLSGHVKINVTLTGGGNAVISGAFFSGAAETVTVSPASVSLGANQQKQFTATVTGAANQTVSWMISAVNPVGAPAGNISSSGLYTAPAAVSAAQVTIKATSADGIASGTATVNLSNGAVASFVGTDTSTQGNWHGIYGADGYSIANDTQGLPAYATFAVQGQLSHTWATGTSDPRALQKGNNTGRIASTWYNSTSFSFDVNFTDGNSHRFALYALDWDSKVRAESVQVLDANSGAVLDTRNISLFNNGIYLIWNLSGHVKINVTRTAGGNAVISGAFFR